MGRRVNIDGPGDDPDEYWFECDDCEGTGKVHVPVGLDENCTELLECPGCGGLGFYEGDANDVVHKGCQSPQLGAAETSSIGG